MSPALLELKKYIQEHVYRFSEVPFKLASGIESHHYFNCKVLTLHPIWLAKLAEAIVTEVFPKIKLQHSLEAVGGLTLGADPISYAVSLAFAKQGKTIFPLVVRKETKAHGTGNQIEGFVKSVKNCLVLEDVVTTGGSTLKAVAALRAGNIEVQEGICILDREEGGIEALKKEGIQMVSLFKRSDFLN